MKKILLLSITLLSSLAVLAQTEIDTVSTEFTNIDGKLVFNQPVAIMDGEKTISCDVFENDSIVAEAILTCNADNNNTMDVTFSIMLSRGDYVLEVPAGMIVDAATGETAYEGSNIAFTSNPIPVRKYIGTYSDYSEEYKSFCDDTKNIYLGFKASITEYNDGSFTIFNWMNNEGYDVILGFDESGNVTTVNNYISKTSVWAYYADNFYAWIYLNGYSWKYKMNGKLSIYLSLYISGYTNYFMVLDEETPEPTVMRGDANGDSQITNADIMYVVNNILGKPATDFNEEGADANLDGEITNADIMYIVNYILNGSFPSEK